MIIDMENTCAVILAGGRSSRMGGTAKCLCSLGASRIIDLILQQLAPQVKHLIINVAPASTLASDIVNSSNSALNQLIVVEDIYPAFSGPLSGIASSMHHIKTQLPKVNWLLSVASDTPFIPANLYSKFYAATLQYPANALVAEHNNQSHYVFTLWSLSTLPYIDSILRSEKPYRMKDVLASLNAQTIDFSGAGKHAFFNINTPDDLISAHSFIIQ